MKKALAALLAAALSLSLAVPAFAADTDPSGGAVINRGNEEVFFEKDNSNYLNYYPDIADGSITPTAGKSDEWDVVLDFKFPEGTIFQKDSAIFGKLRNVNGAGAGSTDPIRTIALRAKAPDNTKSIALTIDGEDMTSIVYYGTNQAQINEVKTKDDISSDTIYDGLVYLGIVKEVADDSRQITGYELYAREAKTKTVVFTFTKNDDSEVTKTLHVTYDYPQPEAPINLPVEDAPYDTLGNANGHVRVNGAVSTVDGIGTKDDPIVLKPNLTFTSPYFTGAGDTGLKGYWIGVHVQAPDGVSISTTGANAAIDGSGYVSQGLTPETATDQSADSSFGTGTGGKNWISIYTTAADVNQAGGVNPSKVGFKPYFSIDWDGSGAKYSPVWYKFDLSNVSIEKSGAVSDAKPLVPGGEAVSVTPKASVSTDGLTESQKEQLNNGEITLPDVEDVTAVPETTPATLAAQEGYVKAVNSQAKLVGALNIEPKDSDGNVISAPDVPIQITVNIDPLSKNANEKFALYHIDTATNRAEEISAHFTPNGTGYDMTFSANTFSPFAIATVPNTTGGDDTDDDPGSSEPDTPSSKPTYTPSYWDGTVLVTIDPGLYGTVTPGMGYYEGWTTFTVHPDAGYVADYVMIDGKKQVAVNNNQFTINVTEPIRVNVYYKTAESMDISVETPSAPDTTAPTTNPQTGDSWFSNLFSWMF